MAAARRDCASSRSPGTSRARTAPSCSSTSVPTSPRSSRRPEIRCGAGDRFPAAYPTPNKSGLFEYLNAGKRGATLDLEQRRVCRGRADRAGASAGRRYAAGNAGPRGARHATHWRRSTPTSSSSASRTSGRTVRCATAMPHRLTVQAASGWVNNRHPGRPPVQAGAQDLRVRRRGLRRTRRPDRADEASPPTQVGSSRSTCPCSSRCCRHFRTRCSWPRRCEASGCLPTHGRLR